MNLLDLPSRLVERWRHPAPVVAVLRLDGVIGGRARRGLSLQRFAPALERAFRMRHVKAVALAINSPGGSPAQSELIYRRIRQLALEHGVPVFAFAEDVAASGGYWLALAADEIYAGETSLLGSIGVITAGFGVPSLLGRLGIERRLHTAGESKSLLDPFQPENPRDLERLGTLLSDLHDSFKALVRSRRGTRLQGAEESVLGGEVFTGRRALAAGLIDGIGELRGTMRERFGAAVRLRRVEPERRRWPLLAFVLPRRADVADLIGDLATRLEERMIWARFDL